MVSEWILDELEVIHGTRDRCEMWDVYGDGRCDEDCDEPDPDCDEDTGVEGEAGLDDDASDLDRDGADDDSGDDKAAGCSCASQASRSLSWPHLLCFQSIKEK